MEVIQYLTWILVFVAVVQAFAAVIQALASMPPNLEPIRNERLAKMALYKLFLTASKGFESKPKISIVIERQRATQGQQIRELLEGLKNKNMSNPIGRYYYKGNCFNRKKQSKD
jgi:hypothetical protein